MIAYDQYPSKCDHFCGLYCAGVSAHPLTTAGLVMLSLKRFRSASASTSYSKHSQGCWQLKCQGQLFQLQLLVEGHTVRLCKGENVGQWGHTGGIPIIDPGVGSFRIPSIQDHQLQNQTKHFNTNQFCVRIQICQSNQFQYAALKQYMLVFSVLIGAP